jgi:hypothetical protein
MSWLWTVKKQIYLKDIISKVEIITFEMCYFAATQNTWFEVNFDLFRTVKKET